MTKILRLTTVLLLMVSFITVDAQICIGEKGKIRYEAWRKISTDQLLELRSWPAYPRNPDLVKDAFKTATSFNYDEYFGGRLRGFIKPPVSDSVTFNVTGNDKSYFYLSTDSTDMNMTLMCSHPDWTSSADHTKFPEQTSTTIWMDSSVYYYFEYIYVEGTGGDFASLHWKADFNPSTDWEIINNQHIYNIDCVEDSCPEYGEPCDDGNPSTINDVEDGQCNCKGDPITSNTCIGDRGTVERFRYENIPGGGLDDILEHPDFPAMPNTSGMENLFGLRDDGVDNHGNFIQGYLSVPVSGIYKFNITGDDNTALFISSDDTEANKQAHQVFVTGHTSINEHDKYLWQSTGGFYLDANQYYYIEIVHKQGSGAGHFQAYWQTPFDPPDVWRKISKSYIYNFNCDIPCIPAGTVCDDGDPFTNNDVYNNNCECAGTPCSGPDCDSPLANYVPYEACGFTDQLDNTRANNWLSCTTSVGPNSQRPNPSHWIVYNLGKVYEIHGSQVWNYNEKNNQSQGMTMVAIDYSEDGTNWTALGEFNWSLAPGESGYSGFNGPHFNGVDAQYILITSLVNDTPCKGLGKVAFQAVECPNLGLPCDDGDLLTVNDYYNENCECIGKHLYINDCVLDQLSLGDSTLFTDVYSARMMVDAVSTIDSSSFVGFIGGESIVLEPGFETQPSAYFVASIDSCDQANQRETAASNRSRNRNEDDSDKKRLRVVPIPSSDQQLISWHLEQSSQVKLELIDSNGKVAYTLINHEYRNGGFYYKRLRTKKLNGKLYQVRLTTDKGVQNERLVPVEKGIY